MELSTSSGNVLALNSFCTLDTPTVDPVEEVLDEFDNYDLESAKSHIKSKVPTKSAPDLIGYQDSLELMAQKIMDQISTLQNTLEKSEYYLNELNLD